METKTGVVADSQDPIVELVRRAQSGDYEAFVDLVERVKNRVYGLTMRILRNVHDAEDVTQQTFVSMIEHLGTFRGESSVMTWVLRIAANHALKLLRKRRGLPVVDSTSLIAEEDGYDQIPHPDFIAPWRDEPSWLAEQKEVRKLIDGTLARLGEKYRLVFVLRDIEGMTVSQTADILGLSEANVKVRLLRARLQLREHLTKILGDETARVFSTHDH